MAEQHIMEELQQNTAETAAQRPLKARLLETLDAPAEEMRIESPETTAPGIGASHTRVRELLLGAAVLIFAVIGLVTCGRAAVGWVKGRIEAEKTHQTSVVYETVLPLVVMDIPAFESPEKLDDSQRIAAAIWSLAVNGQLEAYPEAMGMCTVPAADVTAAVHALFGNTVNCVHQTVAYSSELRFYYDETLSVYYISESTALFSYIPEVRTMTEDGTFLKAEVAYVAEQPAWRSDAAKQITKVAEFALQDDGDGGYHVVAMRQIDEKSTQQSPY